jgi:hypothetical protein
MAQSYFEYYLNNIEKSCEIAAFKAYLKKNSLQCGILT